MDEHREHVCGNEPKCCLHGRCQACGEKWPCPGNVAIWQRKPEEVEIRQFEGGGWHTCAELRWHIGTMEALKDTLMRWKAEGLARVKTTTGDLSTQMSDDPGPSDPPATVN